VTVELFDDFGVLPLDTPLNSFRGRFFVIQTDRFFSVTVGLPGGKSWAGEIPGISKVYVLVGLILIDHPDLNSSGWSIVAGNVILPDDQQLCSILMRKRPPNPHRTTPPEIRTVLGLSQLFCRFFDTALNR
jgi:hypothetical protein